MSAFEDFMESALYEFRRYKTLGDKTFAQLSDEDIHWQYSEQDNSIAVIAKHMTGNMLSRWTNFLTEDGEKSWRERDAEFEDTYHSKEEMISAWEKGWDCLFDALAQVNEKNFNSKVKIRGEDHSIMGAVSRQIGHYASHTGQIIFIGKMIKGEDWVSLSIPKGESKAFNKRMFKS